MKNIEMFGKKIPIHALVITVILSAAGTGIMASQFEKGTQTFYAVGNASITQLPNRIDDNESTAITIKAVTGNESLQDIFKVFARNNRLVLVSVKLINTDQLRKYFDDFTVLVRRNGISTDETVASLSLNGTEDEFVVIDQNAEDGIQYDAKIFYDAKNAAFVNHTLPVIIGAEVISQ